MVDVSFWQWNFNQARNEGVKFAILRRAYNLSKDTKFEEYYTNAKVEGLNISVYHYSMATTPTEAIEEAEFLLSNILIGKKFDLSVYFVGVYSSKNFLDNYLEEDIKKEYARWIAQCNTELIYTGQVGMWQFGGETNYIRSPKINGQTVDQDYMLIDYPSIIKSKDKNGYGLGNSNNKPEEPLIAEAYTVVNGDNLSNIAARFGTTWQ